MLTSDARLTTVAKAMVVRRSFSEGGKPRARLSGRSAKPRAAFQVPGESDGRLL